VYSWIISIIRPGGTRFHRSEAVKQVMLYMYRRMYPVRKDSDKIIPHNPAPIMMSSNSRNNIT
jgi:hypothetical protein